MEPCGARTTEVLYKSDHGSPQRRTPGVGERTQCKNANFDSWGSNDPSDRSGVESNLFTAIFALRHEC